jgi:hypothetical protein
VNDLGDKRDGEISFVAGKKDVLLRNAKYIHALQE